MMGLGPSLLDFLILEGMEMKHSIVCFETERSTKKNGKSEEEKRLEWKDKVV